MKIPNKKNKTKNCARNWYWNMSEENKQKMKNMENNTEKICLKNTWKNTWKNTEKDNPGMCWRIIRKRYLLLPEISGYNFRDTTTLSFLTKGEEVLLKYNKVWGKIKSVKKINLLVTQCLATNIWRPERSHKIAKSPQIVMVK